MQGSLCKLKGLRFVKINCQRERENSLTGTAEVSPEWFFSRPWSKIELFLALVAPGNCCYAYISVDKLGGAGVFFLFFFFFLPVERKLSGGQKEGDWWNEPRGPLISEHCSVAVCFHDRLWSHEMSIVPQYAWIGLQEVPGSVQRHEIRLEIKTGGMGLVGIVQTLWRCSSNYLCFFSCVCVCVCACMCVRMSSRWVSSLSCPDVARCL